MASPPPAVGETRTLRLLIWIAFVIVLVTDVSYVLLIRAQESWPSDAYRVAFVAAYLALMALLLGASLLGLPLIVRFRPALRGAGAAGLLVMGVLALFSIGLPLLVAGGLAGAAAVRSLAALHRSAVIFEVAAAIVAIAVVVAGFEVSERLIVCPSKGVSGGSGYGLVTGGYHWSCVDGRLDFGSGFCSRSGGGIDANGHLYATSDC